ncbi:MAG: OmpA/MotB family protein [Planctomycetota bacterium]|jgi:chemotaxis protein MotB
MAEMAAALEQEKAQQKALLQAYEKARRKRSTLQANVPADVQVTTAEDRVTFTITSAVLFGSGKADLSVKGKAALKGAARTIRNEYPDNEIEVKGHTDNVPIRYSPYKSNWELSCARALAVVRYLVEQEGFDPARFSTTGCGERQPIASNKTAAGRQQNRRAEIVVWTTRMRVADSKGAE